MIREIDIKLNLELQVYQHIVLLVQHGGKWGAFGISRCPDLMNKDLIFDRLFLNVHHFLQKMFVEIISPAEDPSH